MSGLDHRFVLIAHHIAADESRYIEITETLLETKHHLEVVLHHVVGHFLHHSIGKSGGIHRSEIGEAEGVGVQTGFEAGFQIIGECIVEASLSDEAVAFGLIAHFIDYPVGVDAVFVTVPVIVTSGFVLVVTG